ncbi:RagB/SusD family nutrient uptake outer membrane protein [Bacteroides faecis]|uniref:RagB/SusD family nutrient uptake outer membrane protein n=1 Tax=Bacteroides faecis TaxID=674529 RepID=UPI0018AC5A8D|nr:RagB/SusD family nutrient uptake outer membrane protein [Bacteroides faecis]
MKALKITIIALLAGFSMASCDFLDKEPTKLTPENYFNTPAEANSFLTGVYAILSQPTFYGGDYMYLVAGDDLSHYGGSGRGPASTGLICNNATTSDNAVTAFWYALYSGINRANMFLENIDKVTGFDSGVKEQYIAEARFLRAFYYFNLVECWGDVPFKTVSTQSVTNLNIPRTDKQEIYDFIVSEMADAAETGLKSAADLAYKPGRISQSTAWGILARVYLFRAGEHYREDRNATQAEKKDYFERASFYAQKVMTAGHKLAANYWDPFIDMCSDKYNTTANESIWEAEFAGNNTSDTQAEGRIGNIIGLAGPDMSSKSDVVGSKDPGYAYAFIYSTPKLYNLYVNNGDTKRFNWSIAPFEYKEAGGKNTGVTHREFEQGKLAEVMSQYGQERGTYQYAGDTEKTTATKNYSRMCGKYRREYEADKKDKNYTAINFPILRYADVLLMIAEAENEANDGPTALAYQCLKEVRDRTGLSELSDMTQAEFRQTVKDERAMELCFEYTRRFDLIRWGEYVKNMRALVTEAQSGNNWTQGPTNVYTYFNISSTYNYFPIPDAEMSVNKDITQNNPGW